MGKGQTTQMDIGYMINQYRFWKKEIQRLNNVLWGSNSYWEPRSEGVAVYGIEAAMPRGNKIGGHGLSDKELQRLDAKERHQLARLERLESYVYALELGLQIINDEQLNTIYDCLLDGMTYRQIAEFLATSKDYVRLKRNEIISQISQNSQIRAILTPQKNAG